MVRAENIVAKLAYLDRTLARLTQYQQLTREELFNDQDKIAALERYLFLAAQSAIDATEIYCKLYKLGRPESMPDAIKLLKSNNIIDQTLCDKLIRMVGFRNYLSHGYEHINIELLSEILHQHLVDLEDLAKILRSKI